MCEECKRIQGDYEVLKTLYNSDMEMKERRENEIEKLKCRIQELQTANVELRKQLHL
jgi:hypothetical protein